MLYNTVVECIFRLYNTHVDTTKLVMMKTVQVLLSYFTTPNLNSEGRHHLQRCSVCVEKGGEGKIFFLLFAVKTLDTFFVSI